MHSTQNRAQPRVFSPRIRSLFYFSNLFRIPDNILQNGNYLVSDFPDGNMATVLRIAQLTVKLTVMYIHMTVRGVSFSLLFQC